MKWRLYWINRVSKCVLTGYYCSRWDQDRRVTKKNLIGKKWLCEKKNHSEFYEVKCKWSDSCIEMPDFKEWLEPGFWVERQWASPLSSPTWAAPAATDGRWSLINLALLSFIPSTFVYPTVFNSCMALLFRFNCQEHFWKLKICHWSQLSRDEVLPTFWNVFNILTVTRVLKVSFIVLRIPWWCSANVLYVVHSKYVFHSAQQLTLFFRFSNLLF